MLLVRRFCQILILIILSATQMLAQEYFWQYFTKSQFSSHAQILSSLNPPNSGIEFRLNIQESTDENSRYFQYYHGIKLISSELRIVSVDQNKYLAKGYFSKNINPLPFNLDEKDAIKKALEFLDCVDLLSQNQPIEVEKIYYSVNDEQSDNSIQTPAFWIRTSRINCGNHHDLIINGHSGELIDQISMIASCKPDSLKTHLIYNNGIQSMNVHFNGIDYELRDKCRTDFDNPIITMTGFGSNPVEIIKSANNTWTEGFQISGIQIHWGNSHFYDFLLDKFNRHSYDDNGSRMLSILDSTQPGFAGFSYNGMYGIHGPGSKDPNQYWVSLDIVGHEWMHGILFNENVLKWSSEGRAVNEAFCDIMGTVFEFETELKYDSLKSGDWLIAEDADPGPIRDLSNPKSFMYPDTYNSLIYNNTGNKYERSSIAGYWFYLLSSGGAGTNDHSTIPYTFNVNGIGYDKAIRIIYKASTDYLNSSSDYLDVRRSTQLSAIDLFGLCSNEFINLTEAWNAVGVYDSLTLCNLNVTKQEIDDDLIVFPNPTDEVLNFEVSIGQIIKDIRLLNMSGEENHQIIIENDNSIPRLNVSNVTPGIYFIKLICDDKVILKQIIIN